MYLYHFGSYFWSDRVSYTQQDVGSAGDVFYYRSEYILILGEDIAWKEQYTKQVQKPFVCTMKDIHEQYPRFISFKTLACIHWFVEHWYTSYKQSIGLWIHDIEDLVKRRLSVKKKKQWKQHLLVFPDIWTLYNTKGIWDKKNVSYLHARSTKKQTSDIFRKIHNGVSITLCCTFAQIFQDWQWLSHVFLIDTHRWWYKSQRDPRYNVASVVQYMCETYGAIYSPTWYKLE